MADITPGMIFVDTLRNGKPDALAWIREIGRAHV